MEGIRDGQAIDHCFYCALLYPELEDCPRCGSRLHYRPAAMAPQRSPEQLFDELVKQFQATPSPSNAKTLLVHLHQYPEECMAWLESPGRPSLDDLRRAFEEDDQDKHASSTTGSHTQSEDE